MSAPANLSMEEAIRRLRDGRLRAVLVYGPDVGKVAETVKSIERSVLDEEAARADHR